MKPEQQPYSLSMSKKILKADNQQEWLSLNEELNKHNYLYHSIDSPEISDFQYDEMKKRLIYLEKEFPELNIENSIINKVGYFPSSNFNKNTDLLLYLAATVSYTHLTLPTKA